MRLGFFFFFFLSTWAAAAVADEINESVEKNDFKTGDYMMESFQLTIEGAVAAKYGEYMSDISSWFIL